MYQTHFNKTELKVRGWTDTLVRTVLGQPDAERQSRWPLLLGRAQLFLRSRVEAAEREFPEVKKAIERAGPRFEEHQRLVQKSDRSFKWACPYRSRGFSVRFEHDGDGPVDVRLCGAGGNAAASVTDPHFVAVARSACELKDATAALDWLSQTGVGREDFRAVLARCLSGEAQRLYREAQRR